MRHLLIALTLMLCGASFAAAQPDDAEVALQYSLARSLVEEGKVEEALTAWNELIVMAPEEPYIRVEFARFLSRLGRVDEATIQATVGRDLAPSNADVLHAYADVYLSAARSDPEFMEDARGALAKLVEIDPEDARALYDLGRVDYQQGRWQEAAEMLGRAARWQPGNRSLQSYRVDALIQSGQTDGAVDVLNEVVGRDPAFLRGRLQLAALLSDGGNHAAAAEALRAAPPDQRQDNDLRWQLAGQLYRLGELEEGVDLLDGLIAAEAGGFRERVLKGMMLSAQGEDQAALALFESLLLERPLNLDIVSESVKIHQRRGEHREAERLLREAEARVVEEGADRLLLRIRFQLLNSLWRGEEWEDLIRAARPLAEDEGSPLHVQGVFYLVDALHARGRSEQALEVLRQATSEAVAVPRASAKRAEILTDMGRGEEAERLLADLGESTELPPLMAVAEVYHRQERYAEAVEVLRRALELADGSSEVLYWLGAAYERSGDRARAAGVFERLLADDPRYAPALNYLGYMWAEQGENLSQAVEMVNLALAQEPDNGAYVDSLGWALFQLGEYDRARGMLERAARLVPDDAVVSEHLGDVYAQLGEAGKARESYLRALRLDGENKEAVRRKLDRLTVSR